MAMFHGKAGKVVWAGEEGASDVDVQHVKAWTADASCDIADTTVMGSSEWKTYLAGWKDWTATVECNADSAGNDMGYDSNLGLGDDADAGSDDIQLELWFTQAEGGGLIYGPAVLSSISNSQDAEGIATVTYTFQGKGAPTFTTTEPTYA